VSHSLGLLDHMPLPSMPFNTHVNTVFESADKDRSNKNNVEEKREPTRITPDTPVEDLKLVNQKYAYHPDPNKLRMPDGQIVDFVVA
jgi:hypothetical protein